MTSLEDARNQHGFPDLPPIFTNIAWNVEIDSVIHGDAERSAVVLVTQHVYEAGQEYSRIIRDRERAMAQGQTGVFFASEQETAKLLMGNIRLDHEDDLNHLFMFELFPIVDGKVCTRRSGVYAEELLDDFTMRVDRYANPE